MSKKDKFIKSNKDDIDYSQERKIERKNKHIIRDAFMHGVDNREMSFYCSKCWSYTGHVKYSISAAFMLESDMKNTRASDPIKKLENQIRNGLYFPESFDCYCENCREEATHYGIDKYMGPIIQKLNMAGIKTVFSCEGLYMNFHKGELDIPYISFSYKDDMKYFDMKNQLLECWRLVEYGDEMKNPDLKFEISLKYDSIETTAQDVMRLWHLRDLYRYVLKYITHEEDDSDWVFYGIKPNPLTAKQQKELKAMQEGIKGFLKEGIFLRR